MLSRNLPPICSIIIPAHNEEAVILRCLESLTHGAERGEFEIIVICNGCKDKTAELAKAFGRSVQVLETDVPSKTNALNLGDRAASVFPRIYMDSDVVLSVDSVRELAKAFQDDSLLAVSPSPKTVFSPKASWAVRAYFQLWMTLPYIQEGMMGAGVYMVSREGRDRFRDFPDIIADDGYFRMQFSPHERVQIATAHSLVYAPEKLWDLILVKTRSRLGFYQLKTKFPALFQQELQTKSYGGAFAAILRRPAMWPTAIPYLWVNIVSRYRARRQLRRLESYVWERDNSSRIKSMATNPTSESNGT